MIKKLAPAATLRTIEAPKTSGVDQDMCLENEIIRVCCLKIKKLFCSFFNRSAHGVFFSHFPSIVAVILDVSLNDIL
jgi:hypothetical protein